MRLSLKLTLTIIVLSLTVCCRKEATESTPLWNGSGVANFLWENGDTAKLIRIFYFVPEQAHANTPVVFVFHGVNRDAVNYRNALQTKAKEKNVIIVAPEFSEIEFPEVNSYQLGNLFVNGEQALQPNPEARWTFSSLETLLPFVSKRIISQVPSYHFIGHSAGAQFLHRLLLVQPHYPIAKAVVSAAGWYTLPDSSVGFPYGSNGLDLSTNQLSSFFGTPILVQVGSNDNDPNASNLRRNPQVDLQGIHRVARARYFYDQSEAFANQRQMSFLWSFHLIPNLNHNATAAVNASLDLLFP